MRRARRTDAYLGLVAVALPAALGLGRPELVALAAPFAVTVALAMSRAGPPAIRLDWRAPAAPVDEGAAVPIAFDVQAQAGARVLALRPVWTARLAGGRAPAVLLLEPGELRTVTVSARAVRWGDAEVRAEVVVRDPAGLAVSRLVARPARPLRIYPRVEHVRRVATLRQTRPFVGAHPSRARHDGLELAEVRPMAPGDTRARVNWRATARHGEPWVTDRHPDRSADTLLFVDTFPAPTDVLAAGGRAAAALADACLAGHDRVGMVSFGGAVQWLEPATGPRQGRRIADALAEGEPLFSYAWKDIGVVPARVLAPRTAVFAVTPMLDVRAVRAILELCRRGRDVRVLELAVEPGLPTTGDAEAMAARRLWRLIRDADRHRLHEAGAIAVTWNAREPLAEALTALLSARPRPVRSR